MSGSYYVLNQKYQTLQTQFSDMSLNPVVPKFPKVFNYTKSANVSNEVVNENLQSISLKGSCQINGKVVIRAVNPCQIGDITLKLFDGNGAGIGISVSQVNMQILVEGEFATAFVSAFVTLSEGCVLNFSLDNVIGIFRYNMILDIVQYS